MEMGRNGPLSFLFTMQWNQRSGFSAWYADICPDVTCLSAVPSVLYAVCT